jgi:GAF domain-containing protein
VLSLVADGVRRLLGSDGGAVGLAEPDGAIRLTTAVGLGADAFRDIVVRPGEGVGGRVLEAESPFWTTDYLHDPRISGDFADKVRASGLVGELAVPVRVREELVGVLCSGGVDQRRGPRPGLRPRAGRGDRGGERAAGRARQSAGRRGRFEVAG